MKILIKFKKVGYLKYISHLDLVRLFERTLRLVDLPVEYSQGYNVRPRFSIGSPLSIGVEGYIEYMEIYLEEVVASELIVKTLNREFPKDLQVLACKYSDEKKSIGHLISWAHYSISFRLGKSVELESLEKDIEIFLKGRAYLDREKIKKGRKIKWKEDIVGLINKLELEKLETDIVHLDCILKIGLGNLRPDDFIMIFTKELKLDIIEDSEKIVRKELLIEENGRPRALF